VHKLLIVVELLLGEIPDRLQFRQPSLKRSLMPYFLLTQALGDIPCPAPCPGSQAIRDGVIEASINHEKGYVQSKEMIDIYSTREPQLAFHQRISFCLDIHNMSVKAMRFPPKSYNKDLESAEVRSLRPPRPREGCGSCPQLPPTSAFAFQERREREQQDLEFAKEMAEDDDDGFP
ncbi:hypothetical protein EK904_006038, partial [Melospiza melodia maxima]